MPTIARNVKRRSIRGGRRRSGLVGVHGGKRTTASFTRVTVSRVDASHAAEPLLRDEALGPPPGASSCQPLPEARSKLPPAPHGAPILALGEVHAAEPGQRVVGGQEVQAQRPDAVVSQSPGMFCRRLARVPADGRPAVEVARSAPRTPSPRRPGWRGDDVAPALPARVGSSPRSIVRISFGSVSTGPIWRIHRRTRMRIARHGEQEAEPAQPDDDRRIRLGQGRRAGRDVRVAAARTAATRRR